MRKMVNALLIALGGFSLAGCSLHQNFPFVQWNTHTSLVITTQEDTNHGVPFYVLIKEVEKTEFLSDAYREVSKQVLYYAPEENPCLVKQVLIPGEKYHFNVPASSRSTLLGVYFLFSDTDQEWKVLIDPAFKQTQIRLENGEIQVIEQ